MLHTSSSKRDLSECYGKWGTVHQRFKLWRGKGIWKNI
ncbi:MAG: transposase [Alphaproteobacteria bacterium]|nr:transposase [Alphaproteobacteria bacterium]